MCNSPVVRAEPLKFKEEGLKDVVKDIFLPLHNVYRFLTLESFRYESNGAKFQPDSEKVRASSNVMDRWINASVQGLMVFVRKEMDAYRLYTVVPKLVNFLENLTNWYVRLNRERVRGSNGPDEAYTALCTLYEVLLKTLVCLAPVTPFIVEHIYQNLARALPDGHEMKADSIHFLMIPEANQAVMEEKTLEAFRRM